MMKKIIPFIISLFLILAIAGTVWLDHQSKKLERTVQYDTVMRLSNNWTEEDSSDIIGAAKYATKSIPGILCSSDLEFTGNKSTIKTGYDTWQRKIDKYYRDTTTDMEGNYINPNAALSAVDPGDFDDDSPVKLTSTKWTPNNPTSIPSNIIPIIQKIVFNGTTYSTTYHEPYYKKDVGFTCDGHKYVGFILINPHDDISGPDSIGVSLVLAYMT